MIEGLGDDIARLLIRYRAQTELFRTGDGKIRFSLSDVIRGWLFGRAVERGLTPVPNVSVLEWRLDLACLQGRRLTHIFLLWWNRQQDFRQLLLFPSSVDRVLLALNPAAVPEGTGDITVVRVTDAATVRAAEREGITIIQLHLAWEQAHMEALGSPCPVPRRHRTTAAARLLQIWQARASEYDVRGYLVWFMARQRAVDASSLPRMGDAASLESIGAYLAQLQTRDRNSIEKVTDEWIARGGFAAALGEPERSGVRGAPAE